MMYRLRTFTSFLLLPFSVSFGQRDVAFERILTDEGLSQGTVHCIMQDAYGFLWLGGTTGLVRYDGYTFKRYLHNPADSTSISGETIWSVAEDVNGDLWIGTSGRGLNRYVRSEGRFIRYKNIAGDSTSLLSDEVTSVCVDAAGNVWAGSWNGGLNRFERATNSFVHYKVRDGLVSSNVNRLLHDRAGRLWIGTRRGLNRLDTSSLRAYKSEPNVATTLPGEYINSLFESRNGTLWIGTDRGVCTYNPSSDDFTRYDIPALTRYPVSAICEDVHGRIWAGTDGGGLTRLDLATGNHTTFLADTRDPSAISANVILSLFKDRTGILWIGAVANGLSKLDAFKRKFRHFRSHSPTVNALFEDRRSSLWIGTQEGVNRMDAASGAIISYRDSVHYPKAFRSHTINTIGEDADEHLWVGTWESGLMKFNRRTGAFKRYRFGSSSHDIGNDCVTSLLRASDGSFWLGLNGDGVNKLILERDSIVRFSTRTSPSFPADYVWAIHEDRRGDLWFGTWGVGVIRRSTKTGETTAFHARAQRTNGSRLSGNIVVAIAEDADGFLWFGTWGDGLNRYDPVRDEFTHYSSADGLPHTHIYGILTDDSTRTLWLTTANGLARFNPQKRTCVVYQESDGVQSIEFRRGAVHKGRSGAFYVGGVNGFNVFRPSEITTNVNVPPVVLASVRALDRELPHSSGELRLAYDQNVLAFEFAALDFREPRKNLYSYMLEGLENQWTQPGRARLVSYTHVAPGNYTFRVRGSNNDGLWNMSGASFRFTILPPFWQTWWFRLLAAAAIVSLVALVFRYRLQKLLEIERVRVRIASDLHDEVGSSLTKIALYSDLLKDSTDKNTLRELRGKIGTMSRETVAKMSDMVWSIDARNDTVGNLLDRMRDTALEMLQPKNIELEFATKGLRGDTKLTIEVRENLYMIFKEAVNNIVKYSGASTVHVELNNSSKVFTMTVHDNGKGLTGTTKKSGQGLRNMSMRAKRLDGTLEFIQTHGLKIILTTKPLM